MQRAAPKTGIPPAKLESSGNQRSGNGTWNGREKKQTNALVMEPGNHVWFDAKGVFLHCQGILQNLTKSGMSPPLFHP